MSVIFAWHNLVFVVLYNGKFTVNNSQNVCLPKYLSQEKFIYTLRYDKWADRSISAYILFQL